MREVPSDALVELLDRLESESAIRRLVGDYCQGVDKQDWPRFAGVWHDDAVWEVVPDSFPGVAAIVQHPARCGG